MAFGFEMVPTKEDEGLLVVLDRVGFEWGTKIHLRRMDGEGKYGNQNQTLCKMPITSSDKRRLLVKGEQVFWPPAKLCEKCDLALEQLAKKNDISLSRPKEFVLEDEMDTAEIEIRDACQQTSLPLGFGFRGKPSHPKMDA